MSPGIAKVIAKDRSNELKPFFAIGGEILEDLDRELEDSANMIMKIAEADVPKKTWRLHDGHRVEKVKKFYYRVVNDVYYAFWVHEGTRWMEPRPWLKDAHDYVVDGLIARFNRRIDGNPKMSIEEASKLLSVSWPPRRPNGQFAPYKDGGS